MRQGGGVSGVLQGLLGEFSSSTLITPHWDINGGFLTGDSSWRVHSGITSSRNYTHTTTTLLSPLCLTLYSRYTSPLTASE